MGHHKCLREPDEECCAERIPALAFVLLAVVAALAFLHTIRYEFVFDDDGQILRNPWIRDWSKIGEIFATDVWRFSNPAAVTNYYRPLHMVLYMVGYSLFGLHPAGYHVLSIILHALCTILVAAIGLRVTRRRIVGLLGGLLFAVHPIHAESVAWIAGVTDPLCAVFFFAALYFHLRDGEMPENRLFRALAPILYFCALLSKEMAFTFPLVAVGIDWTLRRKFRWPGYAAYAGAFVLYAGLRMHALGRFLVQQLPLNLDPLTRILSTIELAGNYAVKMFVPFDIRTYYVFAPTRSILSLGLWVAIVALAALILTAVRLARRREVVFLTGYCLLTLAPLLSLSYGWESVFQVRYLYLPSLGACLLVALAARAFWLVQPLPSNWAGNATAVTLAVLLAAMGLADLWNTTWMWRDNLTFYTETMRRTPNSTLMASNLGRYYLGQGDLDRSEAWYRRSLELWDISFIKRDVLRISAYEGLGTVALKRFDFGAAREYFQKAYEVAPETFETLLHLGTVHGAMGDFATALEYYRRALAKNPRSEVIHNNIAAALLSSGQPDEAIAQAQMALGIHPRLAESYLIIGRAYADKGWKDRARQAYLEAREVDPNSALIVQEQLRLLDGEVRHADETRPVH